MPRYLATLLVAAFFLPTAAFAHSTVIDTKPADGAKLATLPAQAVLTFDEPPKMANVVLGAPDGTVHTLATRVEGPRVIAKLPSLQLRGTYGLSYRVVSADGHPVTGTAAFAVTTGPAAPTATPAPAKHTVRTYGPVPMIALGLAVVALVAIALAAARARRR